MAGDWIPIERATPDKPEVWAIAQDLNADPAAVLGNLIKIWLWFDEQTTNGDAACNASSVTSVTLTKRIDSLTGVSGFAEAMRKVGWLNGTSMPHFDVHLGKSSKKRLLTARRVKRLRNADSVTESLPQKRTEESKPPIPPQAGFDAFWRAWPSTSRKGGKSECLRRWRRSNFEGSAAEIVAHVEAMKRSSDWTKEEGAFVPAPSVYLNQRRWEGAEVGEPKRLKVAL